MSALPKPEALGSQAAWSAYATIRGARGAQLDQACRAMWGAVAAGDISEADASFLQATIDSRRPAAACEIPGKFAGFRAGRVQPRQRPRSPDRQASRELRRTLGGSSALPPQLRSMYTEGQRAVLAVIGGAVKAGGACDFPIDKIAALAGVCRTTVQTTLHQARRLGHLKITERPLPGRKHLPNLVEVISREWLAWIKRGPTTNGRIGSSSLNLVSTTKSQDVQFCTVAAAAASQGALRSRMGARSSPSLRR